MNPRHLFIGDRSANIADMAEKGRRAGELHPAHKLTWDAVEFMRGLVNPDEVELAGRYGVCVSTIRAALSRKHWNNKAAWSGTGDVA